jgi:hypothetical protein
LPFCPLKDFKFLGSEGFHIFQALYHVYLRTFTYGWGRLCTSTDVAHCFLVLSNEEFLFAKIIVMAALACLPSLQYPLTVFSTATPSLTLSPSPSEFALATTVSCGKHGRMVHLLEIMYSSRQYSTHVTSLSLFFVYQLHAVSLRLWSLSSQLHP